MIKVIEVGVPVDLVESLAKSLKHNKLITQLSPSLRLGRYNLLPWVCVVAAMSGCCSSAVCPENDSSRHC